MLTPLAWAFTRLGLLGVWRYLEERRRSKQSTFSFSVYTRTNRKFIYSLNSFYKPFNNNETMKTKKFLMLLAVMLLSCTSAFAQNGNNTPAKGDVNEDGTVDVADIVAVIDIIKNGGSTATVGYFYLGTTKPTAENYKTLSDVVTTFTSFDDAVGATASVAAGETLYLLCPAAWMKGKTPTLEDKDGNSISFSEEIDEITISDYVIYKTQVWNAPNDVVLKTKTYYWYVGATQPTAVNNPTNWKTTNKDAGFTETITLPAGISWFAYPDSWTYSAKESSGDDFVFNAFVPAATKTSIPGYTLLKMDLGSSLKITISFSK